MRILVLEACGLNLGFLGCYGNAWIGTPNLDRLAAEGVVFDRHYHGCPGESAKRFLTNQERTKQTVRRGDQSYIDGFGQAVLDLWRESSEPVLWISGPNLMPPWVLPDDLCNAYFDEDNDAEPWLDPPMAVGALTAEELLELHNTYGALVTWFDAQLEVIVEELRQTGDLEQTLLCVTSSGGLPLGEHGNIGMARSWLHEELVHVPLVMRYPERQFAGTRVAALTQPVDLAPTLAALQPALACASGSQGLDLMPLVRGDVASVRPQVRSQLTMADSVEWSLRTLEWAYLLPIHVPQGDAPRGPQLYVKPADRWEVNDVCQHHPELVEELERTLRALMIE